MMLGASTHIDQVFHMFTTEQLQNLQYTWNFLSKFTKLVQTIAYSVLRITLEPVASPTSFDHDFWDRESQFALLNGTRGLPIHLGQATRRDFFGAIFLNFRRGRSRESQRSQWDLCELWRTGGDHDKLSGQTKSNNRPISSARRPTNRRIERAHLAAFTSPSTS